jgi:hypothetical protein
VTIVLSRELGAIRQFTMSSPVVLEADVRDRVGGSSHAEFSFGRFSLSGKVHIVPWRVRS